MIDFILNWLPYHAVGAGVVAGFFWALHTIGTRTGCAYGHNQFVGAALLAALWPIALPPFVAWATWAILRENKATRARMREHEAKGREGL